MSVARTVMGADGFRKKLPRTPGYEGVGRISVVGSGVTGLEIGTRVFAPLGAGTFRERVAVDAQGLMTAPEGKRSPIFANSNTESYLLWRNPHK